MEPLSFVGPILTTSKALQALSLCFEGVSGLKVKLATSELVLMENVPNVLNFTNILGCKVSILPMKYLGLPLRASFKLQSIENGVWEKIDCKLASWKRSGYIYRFFQLGVFL